MKFSVKSTKKFEKEFKKIDKYTQKLLKSWINKNLVGCEDPRLQGKALSGDKKGQWRYKIGDYRLLLFINDNELIILALMIGHRKEIYDM